MEFETGDTDAAFLVRPTPDKSRNEGGSRKEAVKNPTRELSERGACAALALTARKPEEPGRIQRHDEVRRRVLPIALLWAGKALAQFAVPLNKYQSFKRNRKPCRPPDYSAAAGKPQPFGVK